MENTKLTRNKTNKNRYYWIIACGVLFSSWPLFLPGLMQLAKGHDLYFHLMRIAGLAEGIRSGQFPVKVQPEWYQGNGYACSVFYGDFFLYLPALLHLLGISIQVAYKTYILLCNIATAGVTFYSIKGITEDERVACAGSFLYTVSVYRLIDIYVRNAVGEYTAMVFFPLIIYAIILLLKDKPQVKKGWRLLALGMSGVLESHLISTELCVGMLGIICFIFFRRTFRKNTLVGILKAVGLTIGLNLWYIVPLIDYMKNGRFNSNTMTPYKLSLTIQKYGLYFKQLFAIFFHAKGINLESSEGISTEMPLGVGIAGALAILFMAVLAIKNWKKREEKWRETVTLLICSIVLLFSTTLYFPWDKLQNANKVFHYAIMNVQFPWRVSLLATPCLITGTCLALALLKDERSRKVMGGVLLALSLVSSASLLINCERESEKVEIKTIQDLDTSTPSGEEYLPFATVVEDLQKGKILCDSSVQIEDYVENGLNMTLFVQNFDDKEEYITIPRLNYKGYTVRTENGDELEIGCGENNCLLFVLPREYQGKIEIEFVHSPIWEMSYWMSFVFLILIIIAEIKSKIPSKEM